MIVCKSIISRKDGFDYYYDLCGYFWQHAELYYDLKYNRVDIKFCIFTA